MRGFSHYCPIVSHSAIYLTIWWLWQMGGRVGGWAGGFMVFNAIFNNISAISVLLVNETRSTRWKTPTCRKLLTIFITYCCIEYTSPWTGFELTTLVVIAINCTSSCKSNYRMITTTTARLWQMEGLGSHKVLTIEQPAQCYVSEDYDTLPPIPAKQTSYPCQTKQKRKKNKENHIIDVIDTVLVSSVSKGLQGHYPINTQQ